MEYRNMTCNTRLDIWDGAASADLSMDLTVSMTILMLKEENWMMDSKDWIIYVKVQLTWTPSLPKVGQLTYFKIILSAKKLKKIKSILFTDFQSKIQMVRK
jgi:hypothetical protein